MLSCVLSVLLLVGSSNTGDQQQAQGILNALKEQMPNCEMIINPTDLDHYNIALGIGKYGADNIITLQKNKSADIFAWSGHQDEKNIKEFVTGTIVALPSHINSNYLNQLDVIKLPGVPHNTTHNKIINAYKKSTIKIHSSFTLVILGGDATDKYGNIKYFSKADVQKLSYWLEKSNLPSPIIVINGPRTGKHDPLTAQVVHPHNYSKEIDSITQYFIDSLKQLGLQTQLFNFGFDSTPSAYYPLLGAVYSNPGSIILVPGESVSMISEIIDLFPKNNFIIYTNSSMNTEHYKFIKDLEAYGIMQLKERSGHYHLQQHQQNTYEHIPAANVVANKIASKLPKKLLKAA